MLSLRTAKCLVLRTFREVFWDIPNVCVMGSYLNLYEVIDHVLSSRLASIDDHDGR